MVADTTISTTEPSYGPVLGQLGMLLQVRLRRSAIESFRPDGLKGTGFVIARGSARSAADAASDSAHSPSSSVPAAWLTLRVEMIASRVRILAPLFNRWVRHAAANSTPPSSTPYSASRSENMMSGLSSSNAQNPVRRSMRQDRRTTRRSLPPPAPRPRQEWPGTAARQSRDPGQVLQRYRHEVLLVDGGGCGVSGAHDQPRRRVDAREPDGVRERAGDVAP